MNKKVAVLIVLCLIPFSLFARPNFFAGVQGNFAPLNYENGLRTGGFGGGFAVEGGVSFGLAEVSAIVAADFTGSEGNIKSLNELCVGAGAGIVFDKNNFSFMPQYFSVRASVYAAADFYHGLVYENDAARLADNLKNVYGISSVFIPVVAAQLPNLIYIKNVNLIPYLSASEIIRPENTGVLLTTQMSLGARFLF